MNFAASAECAVGHREDIGRDAPRRALAIRPRSTHEKEEKGMNTMPLYACGGRLQSAWCGTGHWAGRGMKSKESGWSHGPAGMDAPPEPIPPEASRTESRTAVGKLAPC